jgi:dihydroflavonol-4-reductase
MNRALITGSNGFIGSHLVERLLRQGVEVRCMVRKTSRLHWLESLPVKYVWADLRDSESLNEAVKDVDFVYHLGGLTKARTRQEYFEANEKGTRSLVRAVLRTNPSVKRFVYVSSQAAGGPSCGLTPRRESEDPRPVTWYGQSKLGGELAVLESSDRIPVTVIRSPSVYGPRDTDVFEIFRAVTWHIKPVLGFQKRYASFIYVKDLVRGLDLAARHDKAAGEVFYLVSDAVVSWQEMNDRLAEVMNKKAVIIHIPVWIFGLIALYREFYSRISGKCSILNWQKMNEFRERFWVCDGSKARRLLDFRPEYELNRGIQETWEWYCRQGWLKQTGGAG